MTINLKPVFVDLYIYFLQIGFIKLGIMANRLRISVLVSLMIIALVTSQLTSQPSTADKSINRDRITRKAPVNTRSIHAKPKWGFFGTIFHLILEQVNDTKSAYNQISDLVNNQFSDDKRPPQPTTASNGTTETPRISRAEFLNILDRNLKGLRRLRDLEWREAWKDSKANLVGYKNEAFGGNRGKR